MQNVVVPPPCTIHDCDHPLICPVSTPVANDQKRLQYHVDKSELIFFLNTKSKMSFNKQQIKRNQISSVN